MKAFTLHTVRAFCSAWAALGVLLCAPSLWAQSAEPIRLVYNADAAGCPSRTEFERRIFLRTRNARLARGQERARSFSVRVWRTQLGFSGTLRLQDPDGGAFERRVSGKTCGEVVAVLAFASALAIDPGADRAEAVAPVSAPTAPAAEASVPAAADPLSERPPGARVEGYDAVDYSGGLSALSGRWSSAIAVGGGAGLGLSPELVLGGGLEISWKRLPPSRALSVGVGVGWLGALETEFRTATANFSFLFASPWICPVELNPVAAVGFRACLGLDLGTVLAEGADVEAVQTQVRFWAQLTPQVRLALPISSRWEGVLLVGAGLPLTRHRFLFLNPESQIHQIPAVTGVGTLLIGYHL